MAGQRRVQRGVERHTGSFILSSIFAALFAATFRSTVRSVLLSLGASMLMVSFIGCALSTRIAEWRHPGSLAYLDEYEYFEPPFPRYKDRVGNLHDVVALEKGYALQERKFFGLSGGEAYFLKKADLTSIGIGGQTP